ncbi:MAG: hypothetical protein ACXADY_16875 [Candidatus Hodarchaeales archaeon]
MSRVKKLIELTLTEQNRRNGDSMNCIYNLHAKNISFCLKYKEVTFECSERCPFFTKGKPIHYQDALDKQYDIDCLYCTRKKVLQQKNANEVMFYCTLYRNPRPFCSMCQFALYKAEPKQTT